MLKITTIITILFFTLTLQGDSIDSSVYPGAEAANASSGISGEATSNTGTENTNPWLLIAGAIFPIAFVARYLNGGKEEQLREAYEQMQRTLDERSREVEEQRELLEAKNKAITDSIQYARRIQNAMLPSHDALNIHFSDSLVYYKPKDIVSGDFYWVERYQDTIVVTCADCTGHGVPGAFMSIMGSTLIKEVSAKKEVQCAQDVLVYLDGEINKMLRKQKGITVHDGMDISVFDYNVVTRRIKIASANRPVLFYHKNEWYELKGDRKSLGGNSAGQVSTFSQHEFVVEPGDIIYMFSDGFTDQFGGEDNKKLKKSGFLAWLKEISHLNMQDQRHIIRQNFHRWKGNREQTDDIILLGIRF